MNDIYREEAQQGRRVFISREDGHVRVEYPDGLIRDDYPDRTEYRKKAPIVVEPEFRRVAQRLHRQRRLCHLWSDLWHALEILKNSVVSVQDQPTPEGEDE